jgi:putative intracellular protease/amidase
LATLRVLIPLPLRDFDPSEVSLSWQILRQSGIDVSFASPGGKQAQTDPVMITGEGLDLWSFIPILKKIKLLGLLLRASSCARSAYSALQQDPCFLNPISYDDIRYDDYHGLLLPGGHARGMRPFLEDKTLQGHVADFFDRKLANGQPKPVAAICHGVVLAARSISKQSGKSVLHPLKTTALPWAFENNAWSLCKYFARGQDRDYYRTYLEQPGEAAGYASVEQEVTRALASPDQFLNVSDNSNHHFRKSSGLFRDSLEDSRPAWLVQDGHYLSARWPGDVHSFAKTFVAMLENCYHNE